MNEEELRQELEKRERDGMTNGELIRTLFPDGIYHSHGDEICIYLNNDGCLYFSLEWWNAEVAFNWIEKEELTRELMDNVVEQEKIEDCISRQAVLALAKEECDTAIIPYRKFVKDINALPPVTPTSQ